MFISSLSWRRKLQLTPRYRSFMILFLSLLPLLSSFLFHFSFPHPSPLVLVSLSSYILFQIFTYMCLHDHRPLVRTFGCMGQKTEVSN